MKKNIGTFDRVIRFIVGIILFVGVLFVSNIFIKLLLIGLAIFSIYEALVGWCALYALLGRNTCPIE